MLAAEVNAQRVSKPAYCLFDAANPTSSAELGLLHLKRTHTSAPAALCEKTAVSNVPSISYDNFHHYSTAEAQVGTAAASEPEIQHGPSLTRKCPTSISTWANPGETDCRSRDSYDPAVCPTALY